ILGSYLGMVFKYAMGAGMLLAVLMIMVSGLKIIMAMDDKNAVADAKKQIQRGIIGLAILILSSVILYTINPLFFKIGESSATPTAPMQTIQK
ncbi:MAG TPA: hypothetical protein PLQ36_01595, partial [Candidatus Gracilibacteria bacterium]|nr:hypothetical protein [Candidatus Gracilibacteria bacterium]